MTSGYTPTQEKLFPVGTAAARWAFTAEQVAVITSAYELLRDKGNETAHGEVWDYMLDQAHHGLGLILAMVMVKEIRDRGVATTEAATQVPPPQRTG
jgi:hypothetical protein